MEMVTITRDEYVRLQDAAEMLDDIAAFDAAMVNRAEGLPHEFMKRLIEGEAPLRVFRDWRGLTQSALARESGVNRVQIANIRAARIPAPSPLCENWLMPWMYRWTILSDASV